MLFGILKKVFQTFKTILENVNKAILKEVENFTMKIKINYQINELYSMKK